MTARFNDLTASKAAVDKEIEMLKANGAQMSDQNAALKMKHADLLAVKGTLDARISDLETAAQKDQSQIAAMTKQIAQVSTLSFFISVYLFVYTHPSPAPWLCTHCCYAQLQAQVKMLEAQTQKQSEELSGMTKKYNELTTTKAMRDKEVEDLKKQLTALQMSSTKSVADLQAQLKMVNDESAAAKVSASKTIADWEALCKKNAADIATANKRIIELEAALTNREAMAKKDASTIAALERQFLVRDTLSTRSTFNPLDPIPHSLYPLSQFESYPIPSYHLYQITCPGVYRRFVRAKRRRQTCTRRNSRLSMTSSLSSAHN